MILNQDSSGTTKLACPYIEECSGCQIAHLDKNEQTQYKKSHFTSLWTQAFGNEPTINFLRKFETQFRHRADLTIQKISNEQRIGFYKKNSNDILDIETCPLLSVELNLCYEALRKIEFPIEKGSIRIRVSPAGQTGLWIDFSNEDIKKLLDEKTTLTSLNRIFSSIEIGQKRKKLTASGEHFKLSEPAFENWFETYDHNLDPIPLPMNIGGFSQTGFHTNKLLIEVLITELKTIPNYENQTWLELCSGSGNLTFPLMSLVKKVIATEIDKNAVESLTTVAKNLNLMERLRVERTNIHKESSGIGSLLKESTGLLADPPRSGLQDFVKVLEKADHEDRPQHFIYISCFAETLIADLKKICALGYNVQTITGVDQFPHSSHCEWIVRLKKS